MRWYHLTLLCWQDNQQTFEAAFAAVEPNNILSTNWNHLSTECVVKAPDGVSVSPLIAVYDSAPTAMTSGALWTGE